MMCGHITPQPLKQKPLSRGGAEGAEISKKMN